MDFKTDKSLAGKLYISLLGIAGFMSFIPFLGLISIAIFVINFLTVKRILRTTSLFFSLAILVNLIFFLFVYPKGEKLRNDFNRSGFHEEAVESTKNVYLQSTTKSRNMFKSMGSYLKNLLI
jgi:hypothetical protein